MCISECGKNKRGHLCVRLCVFIDNGAEGSVSQSLPQLLARASPRLVCQTRPDQTAHHEDDSKASNSLSADSGFTDLRFFLAPCRTRTKRLEHTCSAELQIKNKHFICHFPLWKTSVVKNGNICRPVQIT